MVSLKRWREKVLKTCAVCTESTKGMDCMWVCYYGFSITGKFGPSDIPCVKGQLPKPPEWCPKRKV